MNVKRSMWALMAAVMLFCGGAAYSRADRALKKAKKPGKTCMQKCSEQHKKDAEACKLKKAKDSDQCRKRAQVKKDKCAAGCKK